MWIPALVLMLQAVGGGELPHELARFVPDGSRAVDFATADLNRDGRSDYILVTERPDPAGEDAGSIRTLHIVTRDKNGALERQKRNDKVVLCSRCGGMMGDPYQGIDAGKGTFTVVHYGGSGWRWSTKYKFNYSRIDRTWQLVRVETESFHSSSPDESTVHVETPPRDFGKIDIADFDPYKYLRAGAR